MTTLPTVEQVGDITGETVTTDDITRAAYDTEIHCGRPFIAFDDGVLSATDTAWLHRAVAHQAAWRASRTVPHTGLDATAVADDGASATLTPDGLTCAPMARRAINHLSWCRDRTVAIGTARRRGDFLTRTDAPAPNPWRPAC